MWVSYRDVGVHCLTPMDDKLEVSLGKTLPPLMQVSFSQLCQEAGYRDISFLDSAVSFNCLLLSGEGRGDRSGSQRSTVNIRYSY